MTDAVEVAIEAALLSSATEFANNNSITIALPNIAFIPPTVTLNAKFLRATFMPVPSLSLAVSFSGTNQHYGIFQIDVFYGQGSGEMAPARLAASIIENFKPGTTLSNSGFTTRIIKTPYRGPLIKDDPWTMIPVSIPYITFASNPA
jgi:hypothetical protein